MSLFRSDKMGYFSLIASQEFAWEIFNEIGGLDALQFIDLNADETSFKRPYSNYVKRCEEMESKLSLIQEYMKKFNQEIILCEDYKAFLKNLREAWIERHKAEKTYLDDVEKEINENIQIFSEQIKSYEELVSNYNHLLEYREVLLKTNACIVSDDFAQEHKMDQSKTSFKRDIKVTYLAGVINKEDSLRFRRILFRITRGNALYSFMDIEKPENLDNQYQDYFLDSTKIDSKLKTVFLIVYQSGENDMLKHRLNRVCESFGASKYGVPEDLTSFTQKLKEVEDQKREAQQVVRVTKERIRDMLSFFSLPSTDKHSYSHIEGLKLFVQKEKALYHNLNKMQLHTALIKGNCWCPLDRVQDVRDALASLIAQRSDMGGFEFTEVSLPAGISPPTAFKTNSFTGVFQEIVNTYGIPRYREINPGIFTIATFPFLFGVMFGDIAHGALLFAAGLYLIFWKDSIQKNKESIWNLALPARYLLAFQGFFAFYCGMIYNDLTSIPLNIFGSCYTGTSGEENMKTADCTYPFGIDPGWYKTSNELTFINSFKMKLAIILGVTQMMFGIVLRGFNNVFNKKWLDFFFEFIPMLIFMSVTFGYMVFLIFLKWALPWGQDDYNVEQAPSIINIFIKMALNPGKWDPTLGIPLYGDDGQAQATVQLLFLLTAVVCAFLILLPKPIILWTLHREKSSIVHDTTLIESGHELTKKLLNKSDFDENQVLIAPQPEKQKDFVRKVETNQSFTSEEHIDIGEIVVHQIIETIEFVLCSISNTASYLRLWALSLAHSQLAKVFFDNSLGYAIGSGNILIVFVAFWIFANISLGVLMLMDQLECFLHALRLHWVEFQNKFYKADGYAFQPISFEQNFQGAK